MKNLPLFLVWGLLHVLLSPLYLVGAQNLTDEQIAVVSQRLAESAQKSWELGTRSQTILEVNATLYSVFSHNTLPPPSVPPENLTDVLVPFFNLARDVVSEWVKASANATEPLPLIPGDGSVGDPAAIGMSVLLANWTGQANVSGLDFASAARAEVDYLLNFAPRTPDGAISHRVSELQLWSDFVYMVPPFLAYYGVMTENRTLLLEAYNQINLHRKHLRDQDADSRWKHVLGSDASGPGHDEDHWTTGNGWAAAGILRVLATFRNSQYANTLKDEQKDLGNWVKEIHDGMYAVLDDSVNMFANYPDVSADSPGNFHDASGSALLASTVFRGAVMLDQFTHVPAAEKIRRTLLSPSGTASSSAASSTDLSPTFENYVHLTKEGWLTPVVDPNSYGQQGSQSPESEAFVLQLHSAWRDWVADGARGANAGTSVRLAWLGVDSGGWMWYMSGWWILVLFF
ncbi:hypothetical protein D9756_009198 [Leucocoprinus leucothites]|uniref:Glycoside hydrolase family 105 protein n=1 Tax=Leucocoprinus leucothites TaxID=201217 RepID=A0A8H5CXX5_9AGAR|nr:hypothetical protein D9756_009198 [Leucoagaricus leucothites]